VVYKKPFPDIYLEAVKRLCAAPLTGGLKVLKGIERS
jgi:hypothetical protein